MSGHTPSTDQARDNYMEGMSAFYGDGGQVEYARQFDRWLARVEADAVMAFAVRHLPVDLYRKAQAWADNIRNGEGDGVSD
jgi:hypothetical protein